jgi:aminopeptidase N
VLHQLVIWLGWETFVKGTNVYLTRHRFANAELADYLDALDSVTDRDVREWADAYLRTTGYDTIRVTRAGDVPVLSRDGTRPHRFSVAALDGSTVTDVRLVDLGDEQLQLDGYAGAPVIPNAHDEAYAAVLLDDRSWQAAVDDLATVPDPLLRAVTWTNAMTRVRSGASTVAEFLLIVRRHLAAETDPVVFDSVLRRVTRLVVPQWTAPEALADAEQAVADVCAAALDAGDAGRGLAAMRRLAMTTTDVDVLRRWLESGAARAGLDVDRDTRWLVVRRLVELGASGRELIEAEAAADRSSNGHQASLAALAGRPEPAAKEDAWQRICDSNVSNRDFTALVAGLWTPGQEELFAPYLDRYLEDAPRIAERSQSFADAAADAAPRTPMGLDRFRRFRDDLDVASTGTTNTVLRRGWEDTVDDYDVAIRVRLAG